MKQRHKKERYVKSVTPQTYTKIGGTKKVIRHDASRMKKNDKWPEVTSLCKEHIGARQTCNLHQFREGLAQTWAS